MAQPTTTASHVDLPADHRRRLTKKTITTTTTTSLDTAHSSFPYAAASASAASSPTPSYPSPTLPTSPVLDSAPFAKNHANALPSRPYHRPRLSVTEKSSTDLLGSRFDSAAVLQDLNAVQYARAIDHPDPSSPASSPSAAAAAAQPLSPAFATEHRSSRPSQDHGPRYPQHLPTVADPTVDLSQSLAATGRKMQDVTIPRPDRNPALTSPRQRMSDEAKENKLKKKTGFSSFFNLTSPRRPAISAPENPVHVTHVGYDQQTGEFTGLPREWQRTLQANGITEQEQKKHPQAIIDVVTFYNENNEKGSDDWTYHKFDNVHPGQSPLAAPASGHSPSIPSPGGYGNNMMSPPASPRFPKNEGESFENPRAPPPVPGVHGLGLSTPASPQMSNILTPMRAAPKPPTTSSGFPQHVLPQRAAPPIPGQPARERAGTEDGFGPRYGAPSVSSDMSPNGHSTGRNRSNTGPTLQYQPVLNSPQQYQQQQEQAMMAAQVDPPATIIGAVPIPTATTTPPAHSTRNSHASANSSACGRDGPPASTGCGPSTPSTAPSLRHQRRNHHSIAKHLQSGRSRQTIPGPEENRSRCQRWRLHGLRGRQPRVRGHQADESGTATEEGSHHQRDPGHEGQPAQKHRQFHGQLSGPR
nr:serine/threonine-protein kinase ste20 [Quercus suber]